MEQEAFSGFHPVVNLAFFLVVIAVTMFVLQPVFLALSLLCGLGYLLYLKGGRGTARQVGYLLPMLLIVAVMNPLFNHEGMSILFFLPNDNPVTLEAVCYGLASATMMAAAVVWFNCLHVVFTSDKIIYLFGRLIPAMSLLVSMTLRFVPQFKTYLQKVSQVQKAMHRPENTKEKFQQALASFSSTVSWAMERGIVSADSMKSRGYGLKGRTAFSIYRFEQRDGLALGFLALCTLGATIPQFLGQLDWTWYPTLSGSLAELPQILAYLSYAGACLMPLIIDWKEDLTWKALS